MKTIKKHLKLLWRAMKEGEIGLHKRLQQERLQAKKKLQQERKAQVEKRQTH